MQDRKEGLDQYLWLLIPRVIAKIEQYGIGKTSRFTECDMLSVTATVFTLKRVINSPIESMNRRVVIEGIRLLTPIVERIAQERLQEKVSTISKRIVGQGSSASSLLEEPVQTNTRVDSHKGQVELSFEEYMERESRSYTFTNCDLSRIKSTAQGIVTDAKRYVATNWRASIAHPEHHVCDRLLAWSIPLMRMNALLSLPEYRESHEDAWKVVDQALLGLGHALYEDDVYGQNPGSDGVTV